MFGTLFLMIKFIFKFNGQIEPMHVCNRATCIRLPTHLPLGEWVGGLKVDGQIETVLVCNRATCIRPPPTHPQG